MKKEVRMNHKIIIDYRKERIPDKGKEIDIYWFSGTGNTLLIAQTLENILTSSGFKVNMKALEKSDASKVDIYRTLGLAFPVAEQGTFPLVWDFINKIPSPVELGIRDAEAFMVDTMMAYSGGVKGPIKKILRKKGFQTLGAKEIVMPNNLMKKKKQPEKDRLKIEKGKMAAEQFGRDLISGKAVWRDIPIYSDLMGSFSKMDFNWNLLRNKFPLKVDDEKCTRCRLCEKNCPTGSWNFDEEQNRMIWAKEDCIYCLRCFSYCPIQAISYGKKKYIQNKGVSTGMISGMLKP